MTDKINAERDKQVVSIRKQYDPDKAKTPEERAKVQQTRDAAILDAYRTAWTERTAARAIEGVGLFEAFFQYEIRQVNNIVFDGVLRNNWIEAGGVKDSVYNFFAVAPVWLVWNHTVFFILFAALFLVAWAFFGGAISRIAAIHVARDEKIALRQALNFSFGKILSFASAPVIPLAIVIVIGLVVSIASLIINIPWLGRWLWGRCSLWRWRRER